MKIIEIRNLSKFYGEQKIYENLDLTIDSVSEIISFWGESGSGKSTLLNIILGYDQNYTGVVKVFGKDIKNMPKKDYVKYLEMEVGVVYQDLKLFPNLTVYENLEYVNKDRKLIEKSLNVLGLINLGSEKVKNLSGGEKQRIAILRSFLKLPKLLILDEPSASLDTESFLELIRLLRSLKKSTQILIVTHDERFEEYSKVKYVINNRKINLKSDVIGIESNKIETSKKMVDKVNVVKASLRLLRTQNSYFNKILLFIIFIILFSFLFSIIYVQAKEDISQYYSNLSDNVIIMNFDNLSEPYVYEEREFMRPNNKIFWSLDDKENIAGIAGVNNVYLMNEDSIIATDFKGNSLNYNFTPDNYPESVKNAPSSYSGGSFNVTFKSINEPSQLQQYYLSDELSFLKLVKGSYPKDDSNEILIPDFIADQLIIDNGYSSYDEILGEKISLDVFPLNKTKTTSEEYSIVGIYDTNYEKSLDSMYYVYTSYFERSLNENGYSDLYSSYNFDSTSINEQYFYPSFETKDAYSNSFGTGYNDMVIVLDSGVDQEYVYNKVKELYPNNIQKSRYSYNTDVNLIKYKRLVILNLLIKMFILVIIICSIVFIIQRSYYRNKTRDFSILLSLGYTKKRLLAMICIELIIDLMLISISLFIYVNILSLLSNGAIDIYLSAITNYLFFGTFFSIILLVSFLNIIYILKNINYKNLIDFLK